MSKIIARTMEEIRNTFIEYFKRNEHTHVESSSLIPKHDPSLMFVNSGMVQFKDVFTGLETREYKRATSSQKSIRAGGKHNDLANVGYTARHHTFFEMLGNFSFGDYFKEEAIFYAWQLLTKHFLIPKNKLYVTVYYNDESTILYWKKIAGLADDRIIRIKTSDNFWAMGNTGPCGPCSEIFYDHGHHISGGLPGTPAQNGDRFIEIWNLVFMQYEKVDDHTRILLPKKSVDTGMGLERITAILQGVHNNYNIDVFHDLILYTESILKVPAQGQNLFSYRVIADHLRSSAFLIADGVIPSNDGRGYILRRIIRRAIRHAHQLGAKEPLMHQLFPKFKDLFKNPYRELIRAEDIIVSVLKQEEEKFINTLGKGLKLLEDKVALVPQGGVFSGELAFTLYDTYGFPLDLTEDILKEKDITVDHKGFDIKMQIQKHRAKKAWSGYGSSKINPIWFNIASAFGPTEFVGYFHDSSDGYIISLIQDNKEVEQISSVGSQFMLIANKTPFYGESGGQMGDIGNITSMNCQIDVINTLIYLGKIICHVCCLKQGTISKNDKIQSSIDIKHRRGLTIHHSATHILHAVLRDVLGKHVIQQGSVITEDKLRFDFSHQNSLTKAEIRLIGQKVNQTICNNSKVKIQSMSSDHAIDSGAIALFGEKYNSEVRVVSVGPITTTGVPYSFELCGGTHVKRSGDIGVFKILSEKAIAVGVRRIEAVCGDYAVSNIAAEEELLDSVLCTIKSNKEELLQKVQRLIDNQKILEKQIQKVHLDRMNFTNEELEQKTININGGKLLYVRFNQVNAKILRISANKMAQNQNDLVIFYVSKNDDRLDMSVAVSKSLSKKYKASHIAKKVSSLIGGSGGGNETLAQAGAVNVTIIPNFKDLIINCLKQ